MWYRYADGHIRPRQDASSDIRIVTGSLTNGVTSIEFWRRRATKDHRDVQFTDSDCYYFLFPYETNSYEEIPLGIHRHKRTPAVSEQRICIRPCTMMMMGGKNAIFCSISVLTSFNIFIYNLYNLYLQMLLRSCSKEKIWK